MKASSRSTTPVVAFVVTALAAIGLLSQSRAQAQSSTPREETWVTNGPVGAIVRTADTVYIGGSFTYVGPCTGFGVPLDVTTGQPAATFPRVNGAVKACVADGSGGWYIGGEFTQVGIVARDYIAHILADGSVDLSWNPNAGGVSYPTIHALAVSGTTVYAVGYFTSIGGQMRNNIAALDAATGNATAWNPDANTVVYALAVSGTTVYAGGDFTIIGGQTRNRIAALDAATGNATAWNPDASGGVYALAVSGTTVYAAGTFTSIGGQPRNNIAALDAATGQATAWNPDASQEVSALEVSGTTVYAGGLFTNIGGQTRNGIAALGASTGLATAWDPNAVFGPDPSVTTVHALAISGSTVYVVGMFTSIGGQPRNYIAALDAATGSATAWNPNAGGTVEVLAVSGSIVYAGGGFTSIGGQTRNYIAALDAATGNATAWNPNADGSVSALAVSGTTVYAGGDFTIIGGQTRNRIAALDAATGNATAWNPNPDVRPWAGIYALAVSGTTVYAGGFFTSIGGQTRSFIAALDAATGNATAWNPNAGFVVQALAVSGTTVYAGGWFTTIGGQSRNFIAALDAVTGNATAWNPDPGGDYPYVFALAVSGSTVYAGGGFTSIGGQSRNMIAALDAATGSATAWNPDASGGVSALAVFGTTVYAGGQFTSIGGRTRNYIAALDAATGQATAWNPNASGGSPTGVSGLAVSGSTVYAGGSFTTIGGQIRPYFAQFDIPRPMAAKHWRLY